MPTPITDAFFTGQSLRQAGILGNRQLDIQQQQVNTQEKRLEFDKDQLSEKRHQANIAARFKEIERLANGMKDKDLPDSLRLQYANDYYNMTGTPLNATRIEQLDPLLKVAEKSAAIAKRVREGKMSTQEGMEIQRQLATEARIRAGENPDFAGPVKTAEEADKRQLDNDVAAMADIFRRQTTTGGTPSSEDAQTLARIKNRNTPERMKEILRLTDQQIRGGGNGLSSSSPSIRYAEERSKGTTEGNAFSDYMKEFKRLDPFTGALDKEAGKQAGKLKTELEGQIVKATQSNDTIKRGLTLLDSRSGIFSGPLANIKTGFNKYVRELGINLVGEAVENTEAFAAVMARDVLNILGSGDLGAGTGISDNDRLFAARIVGGDVTLDEGSIRQLLDLNQRVNNAKITIANRRLDQIQAQRETGDPFAEAPTSSRTISGGMTADDFTKKYGGQ